MVTAVMQHSFTARTCTCIKFFIIQLELLFYHLYQPKKVQIKQIFQTTKLYCLATYKKLVSDFNTVLQVLISTKFVAKQTFYALSQKKRYNHHAQTNLFR